MSIFNAPPTFFIALFCALEPTRDTDKPAYVYVLRGEGHVNFWIKLQSAFVFHLHLPVSELAKNLCVWVHVGTCLFYLFKKKRTDVDSRTLATRKQLGVQVDLAICDTDDVGDDVGRHIV